MFQTRSKTTGIGLYQTFPEALKAGKQDKTIWKISFYLVDGTRIRLIKTTEGWTYENILTGSREE